MLNDWADTSRTASTEAIATHARGRWPVIFQSETRRIIQPFQADYDTDELQRRAPRRGRDGVFVRARARNREGPTTRDARASRAGTGQTAAASAPRPPGPRVVCGAVGQRTTSADCNGRV